MTDQEYNDLIEQENAGRKKLEHLKLENSKTVEQFKEFLDEKSGYNDLKKKLKTISALLNEFEKNNLEGIG